MSVAALSVTALTGCTAEPSSVSAPASASTSTSASASASVSASASASVSARAGGDIRATDWANVTINDLSRYGDVAFTDGKAAEDADNCNMLPGGARPHYAEYLAEEPASSSVTEDALVLIDCGSDMQQQMLVPVQLGYDQETRQAVGFIKADPPPGPGKSMTFMSYRVVKGVIVAEVRKADGSTETRRYRFGGGNTWDRI